MANFGPGWIEHRKEALGLNKPVPVRYGLWLKEIAKGNLGYSYQDGQPVTKKISRADLADAEADVGRAVDLRSCIGMPLGVLAAVKQYSIFDYLATILGFAAVSIPSFFLGLGLIYLFSRSSLPGSRPPG